MLFSATSIREIAITSSPHHAGFGARPDQVAAAARDTGPTELPVHGDAAALVADLPLHHGDPFDRLPVAQAIDSTVRLAMVDPRLPISSELVTLPT